MSEFEPRIIAFLCNWCSYAGADLCGVSRYQYPPNIRVVRVMCSTRVDPSLILEVLKGGIDGVLMGGCHLGDCHYLTGNYHTLNKMKMVGYLLERTGLGAGRLRLEWVSASEGARFSEVVTEFTNRIKELGPTPVKTDQELQERLQAAIDASRGQRLRTLAGRSHMVVDAKNVYNEKVPREEMDRILSDASDIEYHKHLILRRLLTDAKSVKQVAKEIDVAPDKVLKCIISLRLENKVGDAGHEGFSPLYFALKAGSD